MKLLFALFFLLISATSAVIGDVWHQPEQVHIAAGESADQLIVVWSTMNATGESNVILMKDGKPVKTFNGSATKFVDGGAEKRFQFIHTVYLKNLEPVTKYSYRVGSAFGYSKVFNFTSWPAGEKWSPRLAVYGDLGLDNPQSMTRLNKDAAAGMYDGVIHVGDLAYDMMVDNGRVGDKFLNMIEPLASQLPYMVCPGNHEWQYNFSNYRNRFSMPGDEAKKNYYTFTMGPVRFISLSTELWFYPQYGLMQVVEMQKWFEATLKEANKPENRAKQPWIIIFGHRPMYCSNNDNDDCTHHESLVRVGVPFLHVFGLEPLIYKYGVDLAIWAHEHSYERLWPVYDRQVYNGSYDKPYTNPKAPVHIVTGSAGCKERHDNFDKIVDPWSAFRSDDYGYTRLQIFNSTHLYLEQVSDDKDGKIIDSMTLIKEQHGSYHPDPPQVKPVADPLAKMWGKFKNYLSKVEVV